MPPRYAELLDNAKAPQTEAVDARQILNNAGGYAFAVDEWTRLDRFLILGSEAATYYQSARKLTRENATSVRKCYELDGRRTVARIVEVSTRGLAPRVSPAIFALALGTLAANADTRQEAYRAMRKVLRTASHLFEFIATTQVLGKGWGRGLKRAVAEWYETRDPDKLAFQVIKYRTRNDMTHGRLLRTTHPKPAEDDHARRSLYEWILRGTTDDPDHLPEIVHLHEDAMAAPSATDLATIVAKARLPWEAIPTSALNFPEVWRAMLPTLGLTALIRNLGRLTRIGVIKPLGDETRFIAEQLIDVERLKRERVHPFQILLALSVYKNGRPVAAARRGVSVEQGWQPVTEIADALNDAFHKAFAAVIPTGKRHLIALDVSGSMNAQMMGSPLTAREASAAMALITIATENRTQVTAFSNRLTPLDVGRISTISGMLKKINGLTFSSTDCSLPMIHALNKNIPVDAFIVYTDNETWAGKTHPHIALQQYRQKMGIPAKLIVVGMTSTGFSIADPGDGGMLDVVGFDSSAPAVMADFVREPVGRNEAAQTKMEDGAASAVA